VRSSGVETGRNEPNANPAIETENQYINSIALAAANDEHASARDANGGKCEDSSAVYQDLNMDTTGSADPRVYESVKPRVMPKPH